MKFKLYFRNMFNTQQITEKHIIEHGSEFEV